mmetsp:Transcript_28400/g.83526  ORF Transcript_28400/g.83526 Transcript_28400/m.83526 type:complete len:160 (-) Transcript_28400:930-1409(-)
MVSRTETFILNPILTFLAYLLPPWLAPNAVTTLGGLHCTVMYAIMWYYSPNFDSVVPDWTLILSGYCTFAYYTFDCMDGKQARRTGTSSPLGQLFDHGFDCICNLAHLSAAGGYDMSGGTRWFVGLQLILQGIFGLRSGRSITPECCPTAQVTSSVSLR